MLDINPQDSYLLKRTVILIFVGYLLYHEAITWNKIVGIIICLAGLVLINCR